MGSKRAGAPSSDARAIATASRVERWTEPGSRRSSRYPLGRLASTDTLGSAASVGDSRSIFSAWCQVPSTAKSTGGGLPASSAASVAPVPGKRMAAPTVAASSRTRACPSKPTPQCSSAFSRETRVSQALQMASRASRGC